jgi:hypothetical protein
MKRDAVARLLAWHFPPGDIALILNVPRAEVDEVARCMTSGAQTDDAGLRSPIRGDR